MRHEHPFGLRLSPDSAREIARLAIFQRPAEEAALVVTPNIDHIATIRRSPALARAYRNAARIVCDGWPVQRYARLCGLSVSRVTGCEIVSELMRKAPYPCWHRFFFVVDSEATEQAVRAWAQRARVKCETVIPPFGFERDAAYCAALAERISAHQTTILLMGVGAPRSEIFIDSYRSSLPRCWAFCVGQGVKVELGLVQRASSRLQSFGLEWLWRVWQEPRRLAKRYITALIGFGLAVAEDQIKGGLRTLRGRSRNDRSDEPMQRHLPTLAGSEP